MGLRPFILLDRGAGVRGFLGIYKELVIGVLNDQSQILVRYPNPPQRFKQHKLIFIRKGLYFSKDFKSTIPSGLLTYRNTVDGSGIL